MSLREKIENNLALSAMIFALTIAGITVSILSYLDNRYQNTNEGFSLVYPSPIPLDSNGQLIRSLEEDQKTDFRYISDSSCQIGAVQVAMINEINSKKQIGICGCAEESPAHGTGRGWYCVD